MRKSIFLFLFAIATLSGCRNINQEILTSEIYKYIGIYPKMTYYYLSEKGLMTSIRVNDVSEEYGELTLISEMKVGIFTNKTFIGNTQKFKILVNTNEVKYVFEDNQDYIFQTVLKTPLTNNNTWFDTYTIENKDIKIENKIVSTNAIFKIYSGYLGTNTQKELIPISNCIIVERKTKYQTIRNYFNKEIGFLGSEYIPNTTKISPTVYRLYKISIKN